MADTKTTASKTTDSKFLISLLIGLATAGIVWWASSLQSSVQHNDFQIQMMAKDVEKHAIFVRDWPSGKYGSGELPSDTRQDLYISELQKKVEKLMEELYTLKGFTSQPKSNKTTE